MSMSRRLLAWRSSLYLDVDERLQLLAYLRRTQGAGAAARELLWPVKVSLWHFKERVLRRGALFGSLDQQQLQAPAMGAEIAALRCVAAEPASDARREHLFREADRHASGELRLGGGVRHRVGIARHVPDAFADFEDHNCYHRLYWTSRLAWAHGHGHRDAGRLLLRDLGAWLDIDWSGDRRVGFAYTTSERIIVLVETLQALRERPLDGAEALIPRIKHRIWLDARHLEQHVEHFLVAHNHIVTNARALAHAARQLPDCDDAPRWMAHAYQLWDSMWPQMLMPDGSFKEGSSFYLLMNVRSVVDFLTFSAEDGRPVAQDIERRLRNAVCLAADLLRPDGSLPRFGNISPDHIIEDLQDVIDVARRRGVLPSDFTRAAQANGRPRVYADGGWGFVADPSGRLELVVHADPRPDPQVHSDAGKGGFELWCDGRTLIRDPGNSTYALHGRRYFRSAHAQNVPTLDGIGIGVSEEYARMLPSEYVAHTGAALTATARGLDLVSSSWARAFPGVRLRRTWAVPADGTWELTEAIEGPVQTRHLRSYLHLGDASVELSGASVAMLRSGPVTMRLSFTLPSGLHLRVEHVHYAPEYGVTQAGVALVVEGRCALPLQWQLRGERLDA